MFSRLFVFSLATVRFRNISSDSIFLPRSSSFRSFAIPATIGVTDTSISHLNNGPTTLLSSSVPNFSPLQPGSTPSHNLGLRDLIKSIQNSVDYVGSSIARCFESEPHRHISALIAINTAVYFMWKIFPASFMIRFVHAALFIFQTVVIHTSKLYSSNSQLTDQKRKENKMDLCTHLTCDHYFDSHFANSLSSMRSGRVWTSVTSNFSHMTALHLIPNMYLLYQFAPAIIEVLSPDRFYIFYVTAGVASSLASLSYRRFTRSKILSLGASGGVVATLWLYAYLFPSRRLALFGTDKTLTTQEVVIAYTVFDVAGLLTAFSKIDFAAHLGGTLFANIWFHAVRDELAQEFMTNQHGISSSILQGVSSSFSRLLKFNNGDDDDDVT